MKDLNEIISRLETQCAIARAQLHANPEKYLNEALDHLIAARRCFEDVQKALSPDIVFEYAEQHKIKPTCINGEALIRCNAAEKVIAEYFKKTV